MAVDDGRSGRDGALANGVAVGRTDVAVDVPVHACMADVLADSCRRLAGTRTDRQTTAGADLALPAEENQPLCCSRERSHCRRRSSRERPATVAGLAGIG